MYIIIIIIRLKRKREREREKEEVIVAIFGADTNELKKGEMSVVWSLWGLQQLL